MVLRVFALTGGIGSGKSAAAARLRSRGMPVVNADELSRVVVQPGGDAIARIARHFGPSVLTPSAALDRAELGRIIFADPTARRVLDEIVHPAVRVLAQELFATIAGRGEPLACYEIPLLFEAQLEQFYNPVIVVTAPDALRVSRLKQRDGFDERQIAARFAAQMSLLEKVKRADYVINNDCSLDELALRTDATLDALCRALAVDVNRYPRPELNR